MQDAKSRVAASHLHFFPSSLTLAMSALALALSPKAERYYQNLSQRRMNLFHHVQKIVALSEIYDPEAVARALTEAILKFRDMQGKDMLTPRP